MKSVIRLGILFGTATVVLLYPTTCWACSCAEGTTEAEYFQRADAVFVGVVLERKPPSHSTDPNAEVVWTLDVENVKKGEVLDPQKVTSLEQNSLCGYPFKIGERYKVFAKREADDSLSTGLCSGTGPLKQSSGADPSPAVNEVETNAPQEQAPAPSETGYPKVGTRSPNQALSDGSILLSPSVDPAERLRLNNALQKTKVAEGSGSKSTGYVAVGLALIVGGLAAGMWMRRAKR